MDELIIKENTEIYVLCPAYTKTGGPELLHQLVKELTDNGINAYITYFKINKNNNEYTPNDFKKYITEYRLLKDINDHKDNIVITPEAVLPLKLTKKIKNTKKILWWLSVDNFKKTHTIKNVMKNYPIYTALILMIKGEITYNFDYIKTFNYHLCQSHYSIEYLKSNEITNRYYLSDYINDEYLILGDEYGEKEDIITYNPKKGIEFTKKLIKSSPNLNFIPIKNLTTEQVKELLLKSKVYIDFGNHPGKDRIPREAAMCGCCIITNKQGSAKYYEDVSINDEFKFEDNEENINAIRNKITNCIENYDIEIKKFNTYRNDIKQEKQKFKEDVKKFFNTS